MSEPIAFIPGFVGFPELLIVAFAILLIFGPKRLPEMGRSLGRGMREFKDSITGRLELEPAEQPAPASKTDERADG
jgi:sec-independent protein translocase protein TatA